jgi:hypothetical protein
MAFVSKLPLVPSRVRVVPKSGFSWIDRRFVRDGFATSMSASELALYFFLCAVADKDGLSFFGLRRIACTLRSAEDSIERARAGLVRRDLIAYRHPLYQVLSLPEAPLHDGIDHLALDRDRSAGAPRRTDASSVGDIVRRIL